MEFLLRILVYILLVFVIVIMAVVFVFFPTKQTEASATRLVATNEVEAITYTHHLDF